MAKREKSKLAKVWDLVKQLRAATEEEGALIPVMLAAKCLDLSRTRIDDICRDGRLRRVTVDGHVFITEKSIVEFAKVERKNGRPLGRFLDASAGDFKTAAGAAWSAAREVAVERKVK